jgi:hypothetical protein
MKFTDTDCLVFPYVMVFLDDKLCTRPIKEVDQVRGEIIIYGENGTETLTGRVDILIKPNAPNRVYTNYTLMVLQQYYARSRDAHPR